MLVAACGGTPWPAVTPAAAPPSAAERQLQQDLDAIFDAPATRDALWGVEVKSMDSGRVLYARNPQTLLMPASNMKIVTLAIASNVLGWDHRFQTTLETAAPVENGILHGSLIVRGTGDPTINARDQRDAAVLDQWAGALRQQGITAIDGDVIGDDNAFDDDVLGAGWAWDFLQYGYAAPLGALEFDEDVATLRITPGAAAGEPVGFALPAGTGYRVLNHAFTGPAGSPTTIDYLRHLDEPVLELRGSMAVDAKPLERDVAVVNPTTFFAQSVADGLRARGISVSGTAGDGDDRLDLPAPANRRVIAETTSPPLRDIATVMMKVSQNLYAETLLKAAGAASGGLGTVEAGRTAGQALFQSWGLPPDSYVQVDGSGLSRYDYVSASMLVTLLEHFYQGPARDTFLATLPIGGSDGTLRSRLKHTRAEGNATAKTGSISNVRTLSGFVRTRDGETLAFSMLANNFPIAASRITWMADLAVETLSNFTRR